MRAPVVLLFLMVCALTASAQPGKDGIKTVTNTAIVNRYSPVISNLAAGTTTINVISQPTLLNLCPGDLIMVYQAQGAAISITNTVNYGNVTSYNNAGLFEYVYVKGVLGNTIYLASALVNNYTATGMTQVIKVPQYTTLTINNLAVINAKLWTDTIVSATRYRFGGIIAIYASVIINNGQINANGAGFRGGQLDVINQGAYSNSIIDYVSAINSYGGEKGEGIAGYQPEYDLLNGRYGRGAPANGGGGGNAWNAGGGGGANAANGNTWTGQGEMIVDSSNPLSAWQLDPAYVANSNTLTTSSGGGRGGYSVGYINQNATVTGPNDPSWGLDSRREVGGLGGRPCNNINAANRIYFGGGGGAGDENNGNSNNGGNGGGIIFLIATTSISGNGSVTANGDDGGNTTGNGYDAPSGAGAGGSIVILTSAMANTQNISASGGKGGDQFTASSEFEGPGGGGGGGFVATPATATAVVTGGYGGTTNSIALTEFPDDGATAGAAGSSTIVANTFITYNASAILPVSGNSPLCIGDTLILNSLLMNSSSYNWSGPNGFSSAAQNIFIPNAPLSASGVYTVSSTAVGCEVVTNTYTVIINPYPTLAITSMTIICTGQPATMSVSGATTYTWSTGSNAATFTVLPLSNTIYTVSGSSGGCSSTITTTLVVSDCTGLLQQSNALVNAIISPNPSEGSLKIKLNDHAPFTLSVFNSLGQLILLKECFDEENLNMTNQPKGLYHFVIRTGNGTFSKKIIIN